MNPTKKTPKKSTHVAMSTPKQPLTNAAEVVEICAPAANGQQPLHVSLIPLLAVVVLLLALLSVAVLVRFTGKPLEPAEAGLWNTAILVVGGIFGVGVFRGAKLALGSRKKEQ